MKNSNDILDQMLAETRRIPADERVPYAFEKRIMAHIHDIPETATLWEQWNHMLWRAVVPCVAVMVLAAVLLSPGETNGPASPGASAPTLATTEPAAEDDLESIVHFAIEAENKK
jgi:hypothetical protein